jgi:hypothetical protein
MTPRKEADLKSGRRRNDAKVALWQRVLICVLTFFVTAAVGAVARIAIAPVPLIPLTDLAWAILPWSVAPGLAAAALAARFPAVFRPIVWLFPDVG